MSAGVRGLCSVLQPAVVRVCGVNSVCWLCSLGVLGCIGPECL